ncbi:MAG: amidohydrolase [Lachnospiraceae bacterium]|jgi:5-methylthioadenosine/S-adenosylhomocysteine deaminase|nr:amidohydrolase [Lachnospiraceae bacterium]
MNYRFYHAKILTMETTAIMEGELWVQDDKILYVGEGGDAAAICQSLSIESILWDREIDCGGNLLMPGFKNAHTHSAMTFLRSYADDLPLQDWLFKQVFPMEAKLDGEMIYHLTKLAVLEYLTSGITSIFDMYLTPETTARACVEMGMRCVQVSGISGQDNFEQSLRQMEERYHTLNELDPLHSYFIGFHAEYTCSKTLLEQVAAMAHKYKAPVFTHLSETKAEVDGCKERYGMSPVKLLDSLGMFDYGGGGYHCVWLDEGDMDIFAKRGLSVVTNPGSNTKLASGIAPISAYLKRGINVAIGTDGPASNNCLDMFREMFLVTGLAKLKEQDAAAVDALEVLKMATVNGAKAMSLLDTDVLAAGKQADVIMIDLHQPNMQPLNHIPKNIVYSGSKQNVKMTMIRGRILYENGQFANKIDEKEIYGKANEIIDSLR